MENFMNNIHSEFVHFIGQKISIRLVTKKSLKKLPENLDCNNSEEKQSENEFENISPGIKEWKRFVTELSNCFPIDFPELFCCSQIKISQLWQQKPQNTS